MSVGQIDVTRAATELSSFVGLKSDWLSLLAEQSNSNGGFLALVGLLLALLTLLAIIHPLRKICLVLAVLLVATTVAFLWPQEGQIIQPVIQAETTGRPAIPNATNEEEQRPTFRVTGVSCADVLNVRMQPGYSSRAQLSEHCHAIAMTSPHLVQQLGLDFLNGGSLRRMEHVAG